MANPQKNLVSAPIDPALVRMRFSRPARLRESDFIRREIASRMQERLLLMKIAPAVVCDAGCGAGADLLPLQQRFPEALMIGLDAAQAMLNVASIPHEQASSAVDKLLAKWLPGKNRRHAASLVCADFGAMPIATDRVSLIWSNLALHWHPAPHQLFKEWRRILSAEGLLMFSCFGPDTFTELRKAYEDIGKAAPILPFVDLHDYGDMLVDAGFSTPVMDMEVITVTYESADKLLHDVAAFGGNPLATQPRGMMSRSRKRQLLSALEQQRRADGKIPLTIEVVYGHAFRPAPRQPGPQESIVHWSPRRSG